MHCRSCNSLGRKTGLPPRSRRLLWNCTGRLWARAQIARVREVIERQWLLQCRDGARNRFCSSSLRVERWAERLALEQSLCVREKDLRAIWALRDRKERARTASLIRRPLAPQYYREPNARCAYKHDMLTRLLSLACRFCPTTRS